MLSNSLMEKAGSVVNVLGTFRLEYGAEYEYEFSKLSKRLGFRERMPNALMLYSWSPILFLRSLICITQVTFEIADKRHS